MHTAQLKREQFQRTMQSGMIDVTTTAGPILDIWPHIELLVNEKVVLEYTFENKLVEKVYRNKLSSFEHILLPTSNQNIFVIIIVDLNQVKINGYYLLDLNKEYGIE